MLLHVVRALFILLMAAIGWQFLDLGWLTLTITVALSVLLVSIDVATPGRKLVVLSGVLFGLIAGLAIAYIMSFAVNLLVDYWTANFSSTVMQREVDKIKAYVNLLVAVTSCYLCISFVLQTKDDFRFIIPYVEFSKEMRGERPVLLDTSALIDGRIADIAATGIIEGRMVVPRFVLEELQAVADSGDRLKRNRGRRGLDVLTKLRGNRKLDVMLYDGAPVSADNSAGVDQRLIALAGQMNGKVLTNDYNLNKVAQLRGVDVININDLASALRPVVLPGERMTVKLVKPGDSPGQGVGYLDDGTMVVVEHGRAQIGREIEIMVTSALQTSAGRMIFGKPHDGAATPGEVDDPVAEADAASPVER